MIINPYLVQPSGPSYGTLTTAWIAATGETDLTILGALNTLESDMATYGLTAKMKALYPFVGGTAAKHKYNFMNTAQYELTFFGGLTHSSNGILPNGTNGYAKTGLVPSTAVFTNNQNMHQSYYSRTNVTETAYDMGAGATGVGNDFHLLCKYSDGNQYALYGTTALSANADSRGHYIALSAPSGVKAIKNGVVKNTAAVSTTNLGLYTTQDVIIFGQNANGTPGFFCTKQSAFNSIGLALTDTEAANFYTAVQRFQTTLGRQVGTPIPFALPLDTYSGAAVAYSAARRLSSTYTGSLIRVRRSSDNAEQDIGYDANNVLDEAALTTFVGANNGFVTTWYDQSGNAKNLTQGTAAGQPRIVSSGTIVKRLGKPSINFGYTTTSYTNLKNTSLTFNASDICIVGVANKESSSVSSFLYSRIASLGLAGNDYDNVNSITSFIAQSSFGGFNPALATYSNGGGTFKSYTYNNEIVFWSQKNNSLGLQYLGKNGDTLSSASVGSGNITATKLSIGGTINDTVDAWLNGFVPEVIIYTSNKVSDRTGIEGNINTFYGVY